MRRLLVSTLLALVAFSGAATVAQEKKPEKSTVSAPPAEPKIKVGDMAPDFTLLDSGGKVVSLHDFKGKKNVALGFYVFAFTGG
jgi:cytochrome oxidase Cu insertion factor (SCO1/SenC/PrrC family)